MDRDSAVGPRGAEDLARARRVFEDARVKLRAAGPQMMLVETAEPEPAPRSLLADLTPPPRARSSSGVPSCCFWTISARRRSARQCVGALSQRGRSASEKDACLAEQDERWRSRRFAGCAQLRRGCRISPLAVVALECRRVCIRS